MFEIDYRDLLRRYVDHVRRREAQGHDFISRRDLVASGVGLSEAEITVLESMSAGRTAAKIEGAAFLIAFRNALGVFVRSSWSDEKLISRWHSRNTCLSQIS